MVFRTSSLTDIDLLQMKTICLLATMMISSLGFAQVLELPLDFESTTLDYTFTDFSGGEATTIANPQSGGINTSANVAQMIKGVGDPWGGAYLTMANPIDFSAKRTFRVKVYAPRVGARLLLKVENELDGSIAFEVEDTVSIANEWEELEFDFTYVNPALEYSKVVLIFDINVVGDGSSNFTFLFDDIELLNTGPILAQVDLPITFEDPAIDYKVTDFEGAVSAIAEDPTDPTNTVMKSTKPVTAGSSAGTTASTPFGLASAIPVSATETKMNVSVYSPDAGIQVRLKIENANDPTQSVETTALTTVANAWENLTFDFSNEATGTAQLNPAFSFTKASIFFNFGVTGASAGEKSYYWDNLAFGEGSVGLEDQLALGVSVFPNPTNGSVAIEAALPMDQIRVYNAVGQLLMEATPVQMNTTIDLSAQQTGLYLLEVKSGDRVGVYRLMKN